MAGLKTLVPNPPKTILPKAMDTIADTAEIHSGIVGGKLNDTKDAVTNAAMDTLPPFFLDTKRYSVK
ncbi:MAG: hypothetical protein LRZ88_02620 [Candidatus Cloacimonetes bacterium]|nr:hypothetical protein [Candidatus Cloacimonadota bacterium]